MNQVTIVMYHYVRPLAQSAYPKIKGLELSDFEGQLNFFQKYYVPVTMEEVILAKDGKKTLPKNALLLTFDDGYLDHFQYVLPRLLKLGWQGSFFPPGTTVFDKKVLDVNKIHYILASISNIDDLVSRLYTHMDVYRKEFKLLTNTEYYRTVAKESRYDDANVMFIKRMLQKNLPQPVRGYILDSLFSEYVSPNEEAFSKGLYMSIEQLQEMKKKGMFIGGHGHAHGFMDAMNATEQHREIKSSLKLLKLVGANVDEWVMCYPYGAYDSAFTTKLKTKKCTLGLTLKVGIAHLNSDPALELPRFDTNDFPTQANAPANTWTQKVL